MSRAGDRFAAPRHRVYKMLATKDGLAEFWTTQVEGHADVGGKLSFFFGRPDPGAVDTSASALISP